jgi:hypothetical protein
LELLHSEELVSQLLPHWRNRLLGNQVLCMCHMLLPDPELCSNSK